jgi:hypothetical protein
LAHSQRPDAALLAHPLPSAEVRMPTLRKSIRDAIAADHAAGFTHV